MVASIVWDILSYLGYIFQRLAGNFQCLLEGCILALPTPILALLMPTQALQMLSIASPQAFKGRMLRSSRASTFSAAGAKEISLKMFETWELQRVSSVCLCEGWCDGEAGSTSVLFTSVLFNDNYSWLISFDLYSIITFLSYVRFCIITIIVIYLYTSCYAIVCFSFWVYFAHNIGSYDIDVHFLQYVVYVYQHVLSIALWCWCIYYMRSYCLILVRDYSTWVYFKEHYKTCNIINCIYICIYYRKYFIWMLHQIISYAISRVSFVLFSLSSI